jgi:3-deoxy-D-arabino-heptulosonate 7-phosphate (DAHP) synthase
MIIAGHCLYNENDVGEDIEESARAITAAGADKFRIKLWGGGTSLTRMHWGVGFGGITVLEHLNETIPCGTEVHTPEQVKFCQNLDYVWVGARNCQNYSLLKSFRGTMYNMVLIKKGAGVTVQEIYSVWQLVRSIIGHDHVYIVERGMNTFNRRDDLRWRPDFIGMLELLHKKVPVIFDISHSCVDPSFYRPMYLAAKALGVKNFMFEVYKNKKMAKTDIKQAIDIEEFRKIIE